MGLQDCLKGEVLPTHPMKGEARASLCRDPATISLSGDAELRGRGDMPMLAAVEKATAITSNKVDGR